jgi:hypothetical protein
VPSPGYPFDTEYIFIKLYPLKNGEYVKARDTNGELLYNYSAKEKFGDTFIGKLFDALEANSQLSSFDEGNIWFFADTFISFEKGQTAKMFEKTDRQVGIRLKTANIPLKLKNSHKRTLS